MEFHIDGEPKDISRYVFCPGSRSRAKRIAEHFEELKVVNERRGIVVYSGLYKGVFMTSCGTGIGGPLAAIAVEELGHLGADTFIRVGSCGVLKKGQKPGDIIIASGTVRHGGTGNTYLPVEYPAVPTFEITQELVSVAADLGIPVRVGVGIASDGFHSFQDGEDFKRIMETEPIFIEMESDTVFIVGAKRGFRTGALFASDGTPEEIKPDEGKEAFFRGVDDSIGIALKAMHSIANKDRS